MRDIKKIRLSLLWGTPLFLLIFICSIWLVCTNLIPTLVDLYAGDPAVKISPGSPVAIFTAALAPFLIVAGFMNAIPCKEDTLKSIEKIFLWIALSGIGIIIFCTLVITPLQYYAMPKLGYTRCNILKDHPTMYFTDWVKNPDWCVRGKSQEWVREQARMVNEQAS